MGGQTTEVPRGRAAARHRRGRDGRAGTEARAAAAESLQTPAIDVGRSLRRLRGERGLSIRALAERSGLAVNTLSLIENGKSSPSVSTLQTLARTLGLPVTAFFEPAAPPRELVHLPSGHRPRTAFDGGTLEDLGAGLARRAVRALVLTLEPGADSGPDPIVHTGDEVLYCLSGRIEYLVDGRTYLLTAGDSLAFAAHLPHRWRNPEPGPSRALLVLCSADGQDLPAARHFGPPAPPNPSSEST